MIHGPRETVYLALVNSRDALHARAVDLSRRTFGRVVTSAWVAQELGDALAAQSTRDTFDRLLRAIQRDPNVDVIPFDADLWDRAITLYRSRPDKAWSLTDCTSFTIMGERGIHAALTADRHFVQAGFVALLDARTEPS